MKPKLSVIVTVYNVADYLQESLDSLFNQTFQDFEVIFVNDGSTDSTRDILLQYCDMPDVRDVRILENKYNEGIPTSRNRALLAAQGKYVAIHDGDDISLPDRFAKEVDYLESHPDISFIGGHAYRIDHTGKWSGTMVYPPKTTQEAFMVINRYKLNPIIDPTSMYRRRVVMEHGGYTMDPALRTALDFELWCRLLSKGYHLSNIQEPLIKYRINPKGVTRTENADMVQATDLIHSALRRKNFPQIELRANQFLKDSFVEILNKGD